MTTIIFDATGASKRQGSSLFALIGPRAERFILGAGFLLVLFVGWQLATALRIEPPILLPSPAEVIGAFRDLFSSSAIWADLEASGKELLYGYSLAAAVGVAAGLAIGWYPRLGYFFDPFISFLYAIPRVALGPLLVVWLGIGLGSKVALVFLIAVFPVLVNSLDQHLIRMARCFGAGDLKIFRTIALPGSVPFILGGLRLAIGQALIGVFVDELLGAQHGIGALIQNAGEQFQTDLVFAGPFDLRSGWNAADCDPARARTPFRRLARLRMPTRRRSK